MNLNTGATPQRKCAEELSRWVCKNLHFGYGMFDGSDPFEQIVQRHFPSSQDQLAAKERECEAKDALIFRLAEMCGEEIGKFIASQSKETP